MSKRDRWLLPEGIQEVLPEQAVRIEHLRRSLLDIYTSWGYELVLPPFIEYLESLLVGTGNDLDLQTFKITDQLNGRMMGVRADITPQVARIDAHQLKREEPTRLCYIGTVLHTRPDGFAGSRSPLQVGLELYGHAGLESDLEVFCLMYETLRATGIDTVYFDLGNVAIFRGLAKQASLNEEQEELLFDALQRKSVPELEELMQKWNLPADVAGMLLSLAQLNGGEEVLKDARKALRAASAEVSEAIDQLEKFATMIREKIPGLALHYDLAELRGYNYHTGMVFGAFVAGQGQAIALGGRYDNIGREFGRARPATGFSTDLKTLIALSEDTNSIRPAIWAPAIADPSLEEAIRVQRQAGERVVRELPDQAGDAHSMGCDRALVEKQGKWVIDKL